MVMTKEIELWNTITENLRSKLTESEIKTWFSQTTLSSLDNNLAIIEVPNKFVANWLRDNYIEYINSSIKKIYKQKPEIHFRCIQNLPTQLSQKSQGDKKKGVYFKNNLNKQMNFDNFITGECNRFAFASAIEISSRPDSYYNPFYIYSKLGAGKTHLLNAIGNHVIDNDHYARIRYVYSKKFISDFNYSLRNKFFNEFRIKYSNLDMLLFDDIQYLTNNRKLQEEFLSIFNDTYEENKQIVITGDRPPSRLKNINPQLKSRLGWGLIAEIKRIDYKTKVNIIKNRIKESNIQIPKDIISFLIKSNNDIKTLLKNVTSIETYMSLNNKKINLSLVKLLIKDRYHKDIGVEDIQSLTSGYFNIPILEMVSDKKKSKYSYPRHLAIYLCRKYTSLSLKEIGHLFGDKDHSTIIYAIKKIGESKNRIKEVRKDLNNIESLLN